MREIREVQIKGFQLWKRNYHPIEITSHKFFEEKVECIHQNPVKAGFVYDALFDNGTMGFSFGNETTTPLKYPAKYFLMKKWSISIKIL